MLMPAELEEQFFRFSHQMHHVEVPCGTARALDHGRLSSSPHECGAVICFSDGTRRKPQQTDAPVRITDDDNRRELAPFELLLYLFGHMRDSTLALIVDLAQVLGERLCFDRIIRREEFECRF